MMEWVRILLTFPARERSMFGKEIKYSAISSKFLQQVYPSNVCKRPCRCPMSAMFTPWKGVLGVFWAVSGLSMPPSELPSFSREKERKKRHQRERRFIAFTHTLYRSMDAIIHHTKRSMRS